MVTKVVLENIYSKHGNKLIGQDHSLLITKRSKTTHSKSSEYLLAVLKNGKRQYISSIYFKDGSKEIEYSGIRYSMTIDNDNVQFKKS